jgi:hypothetical protein
MTRHLNNLSLKFCNCKIFGWKSRETMNNIAKIREDSGQLSRKDRDLGERKEASYSPWEKTTIPPQ